MLQISESTCRYAAARLSNGAGPDEARETALFVADELTAVAGALRRLTRPVGGAERRATAKQLAALGWPRREIAVKLGVSGRAVSRYFSGR
jgi:hypothetical protein